ncbi:hypothetical protein SAMN05421493_11821 [Pseudobutyrivibrio sp. 49]|uniref:hypothetical protein n=1 Tax=Pseudobutyrivibrio sp. 49 TaxID=1855344 RepID=UPI00088BC2AD|nr:hypothetical protein [Pseudobutyrivibrio sp. 49]SDI56316.1 hypothetical protein SAMN05421493_11821 [Pseudobutyrivibrio sp. 49]
MIEDRIIIEYPCQEIEGTEKTNKKIIGLEYVITSDEKGLKDVKLSTTDNELMNDNRMDYHDEIDEVELIGDHFLSLDTCMKLQRALEESDYKDFEKAVLIAKNDLAVREYINIGAETIGAINAIIEQQMEELQADYNRSLISFIERHVDNWETITCEEIDEYDSISQISGVAQVLEKLDEYRSEGHLHAPYYIYDQLASIVDSDYKEKRIIAKRVHLVQRYGIRDGVNDSKHKLFCCMVLDYDDYKSYLISAKNTYLAGYQLRINQYFTSGLTADEEDAINSMRNYVKSACKGKKLKKYNGTYPRGKGGKCFGTLFAKNSGYNRFAFSGFSDFNEKNLKEKLLMYNIPNSSGRLIDVINQLDSIFSHTYNMRAERTNLNEPYIDVRNSCVPLHRELKNGPLDTADKRRRYSCCEQKMFSHINLSAAKYDDVKVFTVFEPCKNCLRLLKYCKPRCNSITAYYIDDIVNGTIGCKSIS